MNSKKSVVFILLILTCSFILGEKFPLGDMVIVPEESNVISGVEEAGMITVYFCPRDDCETPLRQLLGQANKSIHCTIYELGLVSLQHVLVEKANNIDVRVVVDNNYFEKFPQNFIRKDHVGEMHNKFCVIDQKVMFTGSLNPTNTGVSKSNNNVIITNIPSIITNYEEEFAEIWNGTFKKGSSVTTAAVFTQNATVQNYFCPEDHCAQQIIQELEKAKKSILFMTFSFTHEAIANVLLLQRMDNVTVEGVMEARQISKGSQFARLARNGIVVLKDGNPQTMHHKIFIIDEKTVITGSMNPTQNGDRRNDENIMIISDPDIAKLFLDEYKKIRAEARSS